MICVVSNAGLCDVVCFTEGRRCYHKMVDDVLGSSEHIKQGRVVQKPVNANLGLKVN